MGARRGRTLIWIFLLAVPPTWGASPAVPPPTTDALRGISPLPQLPASTAIGLHQVLEEAIIKNLNLARAKAREEASRGRQETAAESLLPDLEVGLSDSRTTGWVQGSFGDFKEVDFHSHMAPRWTLAYRLNLGAQIEEAMASSREARAAAMGTLDARQRLLLEVTRKYEALALAWKGLDAVRRLEASAARFLDLAKARMEAGLGEGVVVEQARARLAYSRSQRLRAEALWKSASADLAVLVRRDPSELLVPAINTALPEESPTPDDSSAADSAPPPAVLLARLDAEAARSRLAASKWELFAPELALWWTGSRISGTRSDFGTGRQTGAALYWSFSFGEAGRLRMRRAEMEERVLYAKEVADRAVGAAVSARGRLEAARGEKEEASTGLDAAEKAQQLVLARFQSGLATAIEVFDAEDALAQARLNVARADADATVAQAELLAAEGRLEP